LGYGRENQNQRSKQRPQVSTYRRLHGGNVVVDPYDTYHNSTLGLTTLPIFCNVHVLSI